MARYKHDRYTKPRSLNECWEMVEELLRERKDYIQQVSALNQRIAAKDAYIAKLEHIRKVAKILAYARENDALRYENLMLRRENLKLTERNGQLEVGPPDPWREQVIEWIDEYELERFSTRDCLREAIGMKIRPGEEVQVEHGRRLSLVMQSIAPGEWQECTYVPTDEGIQRGWKRRPLVKQDGETIDMKRVLAPKGRRVIKRRMQPNVKPNLKVVAGGAK